MNTEEVAKKVVELTRKQAWVEALETLYDNDIVSVEARTMDGSSPETRGTKGVREKIDWWTNQMEVHSFKASGPFVAHDRFVVQLRYRHDRQGLEETNADVGGRRLHGQERQDRAGRVLALHRQGELDRKSEVGPEITSDICRTRRGFDRGEQSGSRA